MEIRKQCTRCKVYKYSSDFENHSLYKNRLLKYCKLCNEKQQKYREKTWQKGKLSRDKYYINNKEKLSKIREKRFNTLEGRLKKLLSHIKYVEPTCDLDIEYLNDLYKTQDGKCALTQIEMKCFNDSEFRVHPYMISIDRIDSKLGHNKSNIRLVCVAINYALNEFGEDTFKTICEAYISHHK